MTGRVGINDLERSLLEQPAQQTNKQTTQKDQEDRVISKKKGGQRNIKEDKGKVRENKQGKRPRGQSNIKEEKRTEQHQRREGQVKDIKGNL